MKKCFLWGKEWIFKYYLWKPAAWEGSIVNFWVQSVMRKASCDSFQTAQAVKKDKALEANLDLKKILIERGPDINR